jgi:hypothetical protein
MKFYVQKFMIFVLVIFTSLLHLSYTTERAPDPIKDFRPQKQRRCSHDKKNRKKNYLQSKYDRKLSNTYYTDIQFQNLRMHFDYTYTLPHEEKLIKELIMPPVKRFFENALSVRRFPGKLRFPRTVTTCQDIPVPTQMQVEGIDTDLIILVSTFRGMKKYNWEKLMNATKEVNDMTDPISLSKEKAPQYTESMNSFLENYFSNKNQKNGQTANNTISNNKTQNNESFNNQENVMPWETNDAPSDIVGWSSMCLQDTYTLRPVAGIMQFVADILPTQRAIEEAIWTTLHEITHVLAMDFDLFEDFIDSEFNRQGYKKTIKIKSKLKGLDKLIEERKDLFNDFDKFINFKSPQNTVNSEKTNTPNNTSFNNNTNNSPNTTNTDQVKLQRKTNKMRFKQQINSSNRNNNTNSSYNSTSTNKTEYSPNIISNILQNIDNDTPHPQLMNQTTLNKTAQAQNLTITITNKTKPNDVILEFPIPNYTRIKLEEGDTYYEVKFPDSLNITVLFLAIENFLETTRIYMKTPKVIEVGKSHFSCSSLDSIELEHFGGLGSAFSHWSKRILNTEFMIADSYGENYLSNFTLALFEDSGWYKVDYSKAEIVPWGKDKGCEFLQEKCITKKVAKNSFLSASMLPSNFGSSNSPRSKTSPEVHTFEGTFNEFCTSIEEEKCSITHMFRAVCGMNTYAKALPKEYQYFDNPSVAGLVEFGDYCPYPIEWVDISNISPIGSCRNGIQLRNELGERVCENCRCFHSNLVEENLYKTNQEILKNDPKKTKWHHLNDNRAACYEARCQLDSRGKTNLIIMLNDLEIKCPPKGALLTVEGYQGYIECPKVDTICNGALHPRADYTQTSAYNLFSHLSENLLNILYDFIASLYKKQT